MSTTEQVKEYYKLRRQEHSTNALILAVCMGVGTLIILLCLLWPQRAGASEVNLDIIATIESNHNPKAVSFRGPKYGRGMYQVSEVCLDEYNYYVQRPANASNLPPDALFSPETCLKVAKWYLEVRIPQMLKYYGIEDTIDNRLWAYSAGIGRVVKGIMPDETKKYLIKYHRLEAQ